MDQSSIIYIQLDFVYNERYTGPATWNPTPGRDWWLMPLSLSRFSRRLFFARSKPRCFFVEGLEYWSTIVLCFLAAKNHSIEFLERSVDYIELRSWFLLFVWLTGFRQVYFPWLGTRKSILFDPWSHRVCPLFSFVGVERPTQRIARDFRCSISSRCKQKKNTGGSEQCTWFPVFAIL